jgi:uncharacterized protein YcsI (UPF0317 family)
MKQVIAAIAVAVLGSTTAGYAADLSHGSAIYTFAQRQPQPPRSTQAPPTLSSDVIKQAQQKLKDLGFYEGEIDGKLNSETQEAINEFQDDNNLARFIHGSSVRVRDAVVEGVVLRGVEDAGNRGLRFRRGSCSGASGPVDYGGSLAIRSARLAKLAW